ncbi:AMP-binding protein [Gramella sp. GC03-9]|uniref:AMP-binding protein n=1 Tax=Christiangramia oceanisediminis TaxID=2920386 RepID=A0A9X2KY66_9FLAO|nr:AMP-binding protein [Gramella oceanisediminis]MCP9200460.1 AMP-binding protein [Gramella oceanisediminis]
MQDLYFQDIKKIRTAQWKLIKSQLQYCKDNSPFYQKMFRERDISLKEIQQPGDFSRLPITSKEDLQRFNSNFISVPEADIIDFVTTSGTLGSPMNFVLNEEDLERLAENELRSFKMAGVKMEHKVQITTTLDRRFMAGMAYFLGLRKLGAGVIRTGSGLPQLQWESIERFKPQYLVAVPSFLLKMITFAEANGIDYRNSSVKAAICIGEALRDSNFELNAIGKLLQEKWNIEIYSTYASTEMATAFTECPEHRGYHVPADLVYTEVLNEAGEAVQPGEIGELVVTPLQTRTMPLIRFATGDMLTYYEEPCDCGRNTPRLGSVVGRKQQKIKLKGTSLYPQHLIEVLNSFKKLDSYLIEARHDEFGNDAVTVFVPADFMGVARLQDYFRARLNVTPIIDLMELEEIEKLRFPKMNRKPQVFRDLR